MFNRILSILLDETPSHIFGLIYAEIKQILKCPTGCE